MNSLVLNNEPLIRFGFFFGILILIAVWEGIAPRRQTAPGPIIFFFICLGRGLFSGEYCFFRHSIFLKDLLPFSG